MRYQWGPLLRDGGERRLNVAATRAKHRLTLVSSFSGHDVDPDRVRKAGARMLADYLDYASSGGSAQEASGAAELDSFEAHVRDRLAAAGITVVPQYGVGGYRVDFAAVHPDDPGRMVLAIEADGATYRQSGSVRDRDRLRGEHLQRLGWRYHRLWSTNWFGNPDAEVAKVRDAYAHAVSAAEPDPETRCDPADNFGQATDAEVPEAQAADAPATDSGRAGSDAGASGNGSSYDPIPARGALLPGRGHSVPIRGELLPTHADVEPADADLERAHKDLERARRDLAVIRRDLATAAGDGHQRPGR
jgi:very-short-patch-repair endonuclease